MVLILISYTTVSAWVVQNPKWDLSSSSIVNFRANGLPSAYQSRVYNARDAWNAVSGSKLVYSRDDSSYQLDIYDGYIDGASGTLATTTRYWPWNTYTSSANMEIDYSENWYTGTGSPGATQHDLWSVLTHEFGHASAILHTNASCPSGGGPTMCPSISKGQSYMRSLESDDQNALVLCQLSFD